MVVPQGWKLDLTEIEVPVEQYEAMKTVARTADEGGWNSIWLHDHFQTVLTPELETTFGCWTAPSTLARDTQRVNIGQMIGCNGYGNPGLYDKIDPTINATVVRSRDATRKRRDFAVYDCPADSEKCRSPSDH